MTSRMFATITIVAMGLGSDHLAAKEAYQLKNKHLCVSLNEDGLQEIQDLAIGTTIGFDGDHFDLTVDGKSISDTDLTPTSVEHTDTSVTYHYRSDDWPIRVVYELQPEWRFISKHIAVSLPHKHTVNRVTVFAAALKSAPTSQHLYRGGSYGGLFRFNSDNVSWGMFAVLQNPFCKLSHQDQHLALAYLPKMEWKAEYGEFQSDRVCLGTYEMSGTTYPAEMRSEWEYVRDVEAWGRSAPQVDINETLALIDCVGAFTTYKPKESIRLHVDWCENAYQLDVSLAEDWVEYQRIIRRAADMGCNYILYSPKDESITSQSENRDAWGWEQLLWMNLGPRIRTGDFLPGTNPIPPPIKNRVSYAAEHGVQFIAYAYPTVPFMQDPDWTAWIRRLPGSPEPGGYRGPDTGKPLVSGLAREEPHRFQTTSRARGILLRPLVDCLRRGRGRQQPVRAMERMPASAIKTPQRRSRHRA